MRSGTRCRAGWHADRDPALGHSAARRFATEFFQLEERVLVPLGEVGTGFAQGSLAASHVALKVQSFHLLFLCGQHRGRRPYTRDKLTGLTAPGRVHVCWDNHSRRVGTPPHRRNRMRLHPRDTRICSLAPARRRGRAIFAPARWMLAEEREEREESVVHFCLLLGLLLGLRFGLRPGFRPDFLTRRGSQSRDWLLRGRVDSATRTVGHRAEVATASVRA